MSLFDNMDLSGLGDSILTGAKDLAGIYQNVNATNNQVQLAQLQGQIELSKAQTQANLANIQGQQILRYANAGAVNPNYYNGANLDQQLSNMGTMFSQSNGTNNIMMYLTLAGVCLAAFQLMKK